MTSIIHINSKPIYLGYQTDLKKYCFYAVKQGVPRFLSYINYFFWDKGPQTALVLKEILPEIEQELIRFLEGAVSYEFYKQRKNSKESKVRKIFQVPEQFTSTQDIDISAGSGHVFVSNGPTRRGDPGVKSSIKSDEPPRRRNSRKPGNAVDDGVGFSRLGVDPKKESEPPQVFVIEKSPPKEKIVKALKSKSSILKKVIEEIKAPPKKLGRPRKIQILENPKEVAPMSNGISKRLESNVKTTVSKPQRKIRTTK